MNILAQRNGKKGWFHPNTWDLMPPGKYGWEPVKHNPPKAVQQQLPQAVKEPAFEFPATPKPEPKQKKPRIKKADKLEI
jgi:hypothetical protein